MVEKEQESERLGMQAMTSEIDQVEAMQGQAWQDRALLQLLIRSLMTTSKAFLVWPVSDTKVAAVRTRGQASKRRSLCARCAEDSGLPSRKKVPRDVRTSPLKLAITGPFTRG